MPFQDTIRVLMIEDNPDDALLVSHALRKFGLCCVWHRVDTEGELRRTLAERAWDIVLCDQSMPQLDVACVMALVSAEPQPPPVVMVTGTVGEEVVADVMRIGMADVVLKDRIADRLGHVVEREVTQARIRATMVRRRRRSDAVLDALNDADDWLTAARDSLKVLATSLGAAIAVMAEVTGEVPQLHPVAGWATPRFETIGARIVTHILPVPDTLAGRAVLQGKPLVMPDLAAHAGEGSHLVAASVAAGLTGIVIQPLQAAGRDFLLSLMFAEPRDDLDQVQQELAAISAVMQPLVRRRIIEAERSLLRRALDAARSGVMITEADPLGQPGPRIVYVNQSACQMSGREPETLLGQTPRVLQGPLTDLAVLARIRRALAAAEPITEELQNHRPDGTPFWVELDITPVFEQELLTHFIAIQTDITQRKADEQERQEREASFRLLFEGNPMPMWVCDRETLAYLEVNNAAMARYGWSREAFLQQSVYTVSPDAERIRLGLAVAALNAPTPSRARAMSPPPARR